MSNKMFAGAKMKTKSPKKLPKELFDAQCILNHAVVRGESQSTIDKLRHQLREIELRSNRDRKIIK